MLDFKLKGLRKILGLWEIEVGNLICDRRSEITRSNIWGYCIWKCIVY